MAALCLTWARMHQLARCAAFGARRASPRSVNSYTTKPVRHPATCVRAGYGFKWRCRNNGGLLEGGGSTYLPS